MAKTTLQDQIYELLKKGPMTDETLQFTTGAPGPSVRRSRQALVKAELVVKVSGGKVGALWGLAPAKKDAQETTKPGTPHAMKSSEGRPSPTKPPMARPSGSYTF